MRPPNNTIHRSSVESGKAPGRLWVRVCSQTELLAEYTAINLQDSAPSDIHTQIFEALNKNDDVILSYSYSGTTGECLQTVSTLKDTLAGAEIASFASLGFVPIGEPQPLQAFTQPTHLTPAPSPQNDFHHQWSTIDDQRFLIRTINAGYPSPHERFIAKTVSQFFQRNDIEATIVQIVSTYSATIPQLPPSTITQIALTLSSAQRSVLKLLNLDRALQFLYDDQVECHFHIYPEHEIALDYRSRHEYLHECFQTETPALILGMTAERLREYFKNRTT